ncbi:hypothetical protein OAP18_01275 [Gammaproteobacteria bacterium]|nr:hypothetical protein [Gammaproteobacteria bacterium]
MFKSICEIAALARSVSSSTIKETEHPNTPEHVKEEASTKIFTIESNLVSEEHKTKTEIWRILTGNGKPEKMKQDAEHVFEAHKHGPYFVTTDNRILKLRNELKKICNACIVTPSEMVELIHAHENT